MLTVKERLYMTNKIEFKTLILGALLISVIEILLALFLPNIGAGIYIIGELLAIAISFFIAGLLVTDQKKFWLTGILLIMAFIIIQSLFQYSEFGKNTYELLDKLSTSEAVYTEDMEVSFSDGSTAGQILNYIFYFSMYTIGGKINNFRQKHNAQKCT